MAVRRWLDRREFIRQALLAGVSVPFGIREYCRSGQIVEIAFEAPRTRHLIPHVYSRPVLDPNRLAPFVDPLLLMPRARPSGSRRDPEGLIAPLYQMRMSEFYHQVHRDLPPTRVWGFNGSVPGPTFEVRSGSPVLVDWINALPAKHFLPIDHTIHGARKDTHEVRTVIHLHGAKAPAESDGYPEAWYTPGNSALYFYPNRQRAAMLWYHDHALGIVRLNNLAGLSGVYIIRDAIERRLRLPRGKYEIPLVIQDRTFDTDGQLNYPTSGRPNRIWIPDFFGNTVLVNGIAYPYLTVEPRKYRFRILNASNARFYALTLSSGQQLYQIGSDQGLLAAPVTVGKLLIAPAERADIIVDFAPYAGKQIVLNNDAAAPYPGGGMVVPSQLMQFRVGTRVMGKDTSLIPSKLATVERIDPALAVKTRNLKLVELADSYGRTLINLLNYLHWSQAITEKPVIDTVEIWNLINNTMDTHPIHIHLISFQIIGRRPFDPVKLDRGLMVYTGPLEPPAPNESGWKDTVRADPGYETSIIAKFEGYTGRYVWHCHILEHEDNEMMRPLEVVAASPTSGGTTLNPGVRPRPKAVGG
jgi:spore coat protein A, manganese oxidase